MQKIQNKEIPVHRISAALLLLVLTFLLLLSRSLSREGEAPVFFVPPAEEHCWVEARSLAGDCHIFDVEAPSGVDEMTRWIGLPSIQAEALKDIDYVEGQHIEIIEENPGTVTVDVTWMRAGKRMALGVMLHPDRMGVEDWQDLRGIGPALAHRIEVFRQNNGDFGSLENLQRVSGIGKKTIAGLRPWFTNSATCQN